MTKLMNNNVMKVMLCAGLMCGTSFGMEEKTNGVYSRPSKTNNLKKQQKYTFSQQKVEHKKDDYTYERYVEPCACVCSYAIFCGALYVRSLLCDQNMNNS